MWTKPEIKTIIIIKNKLNVFFLIIVSHLLGSQLVFRFQKLENCLQTFSDIIVPSHQVHQWLCHAFPVNIKYV